MCASACACACVIREGSLTKTVVDFFHCFTQIYNETVRNLLGPSSAGTLDLREDAHGATIVSGLTELQVKDSEEVMRLLSRGNLRRTCEPTAVNKTSSRSHAILKVIYTCTCTWIIRLRSSLNKPVSLL